MLEEVRAALPDAPVFLPGYTNHSNARRMLALADGAFVGSCLERDGWGSAVDQTLVRAYMKEVESIGV